MEHQRIMQFIMNWLQVNNYVQFEAEEWTTGKDMQRIHPGRYNVVRRDPFNISNSEIPMETLIALQEGIAKELGRRSVQ